MISIKLLRPLAVIVLAAVELSSPTEAAATSSSAACGVEYFVQCGSMTRPQIESFCDAACGSWIVAVCNTDNGGLKCLYDPI